MTRYFKSTISGEVFGLPDDYASPAGAVVPVVVISPEDREQVERLTDAFYRVRGLGEPALAASRITNMRAALRSLVAPERPDEPPAWSVVILANNTPFMRLAVEHITPPYTACWFGEHPLTGERGRLTWGELHALGTIRLVGEGVTP